MTRIEYLLREIRSKLWIKPGIMALAASGWVTAAYFAADWFPADTPVIVKRDILLNLLGILASTMLTVATFSVSAMVSAFAAVATTATPRATRIVMEDRSSQNALASFLSAFVYAVVALIALSILDYGSAGRILLFTGFVGMVIWVLVSFIRWVDHVSKLGRMEDTLRRIEEACSEAFDSDDIMGSLGGRPTTEPAPEGLSVRSEFTGYVQNVDVERLNEIAAMAGVEAHLLVRPGAFVDSSEPLVIISGLPPDPEDDLVSRVRETFQVGESRRIGVDPRFGLILLTEVADRALSPAVNDPGTAIAVLGIQVRLLERWARRQGETPGVKYPKVHVPLLDAKDMLDDALIPISRDGAAMFEIGMRLQKSLAALAKLPLPRLGEAAVSHSGIALELAEKSPMARQYLELLRNQAERVREAV